MWRLGGWLGAWALVPHTSFAALVLALVVSTLVLRVGEARWRAWPADLRVALGAFGIALGLATLAPQWTSLVRHEGLDGFAGRARAAWALDRTPAVFPTRLVPGERHFVHAPDAQEVDLVDGDVRVHGVALGHGLFALDVPVELEGSSESSIEVDGELGLSLAAPSEARPVIGCARGERVVVLGAPRSTQVTIVEAGRVRTAVLDEAARACVIVRANANANANANDDSNHGAGNRDGDSELAVGTIVWGTDSAIFDETHRWESGRVDAMVAVRDLIVLAVGSSLRVVRRTEGGFAHVRDVVLDFRVVHLVVNDDAVFAARGTRLVRVAIERLAIDSRTIESPEVDDASVQPTVLPGDVIAMAANDSRLAIATNAVEPVGARIGNHYVEDAVLELDARTLEIVRVHRTAHRTRRQDHPGSVDAGLLPRALAFDGEKLLVAFAGSGELGVLDARGSLRRHPLPVALATPTGLSIGAGGVRVVVAEPEGKLAVWSGDAWNLVELAPASEGARAFHAPTRSGLACASCHVEGSDARHRLGPAHGAPEDGALERGGSVAPELANLALTPPYFRNGAYASLDALIEESVALFGGWRGADATRRDVLVEWLDGRARGAAQSAVEETREGLDAFVAEGCVRCHSFPAFTDRGAHTGAELGRTRGGRWDTPSLIGRSRTRSSIGSSSIGRGSRDGFADDTGVHRVEDAVRRERIARFLGGS